MARDLVTESQDLALSVLNLRFAIRSLASRPGGTAVIVLTMAVAIAATAVIYSAIDLVWRFIPAVNRSGLVYAATTDTHIVQAEGTTRSVVLRTRASIPDLADWSARSSTFHEFAAFDLGSVNLTGVDVPMRVTSVRVTANLVGLWGFTPVLGRPFQREDGLAGAAPVALLAFGFWQREFSSDAGVVGKSVLLDGVPHTIAGVLPREAGTGLFKDAEVFLPLVVDSLRGDRRQRTLLVTGRLKPGVTRAQASTELASIARQLEDEHPDTNQGIGADVLPLIEASGFNVRVLVTILALIALLVVVVACANVSGILIAQAVGRRHELAVRAALGASRFERFKQLMIESTIASALAGIAGVLLAYWGIAALRWLGGSAFGLAEISMNGRVLASAVTTAVVAPFGFALLPALRSATPDPQELKDGARGASGPASRRTRSLLVALQAAAAMILMVQIGLLVKTTWVLSSIAPGFDPADVLTFHVGLSGARYDGPAAIERFTTDLISRLRAVPGVASIGIVDRLPIADTEQMARLTIEGAVPARVDLQPTIARAAIAGDYLNAMRIPLKRGRGFTETEASDRAPVALVNEEAARRFWPASDPLARNGLAGAPARIALDATPGQESWLQVVGVVGNMRNSDIDQGPLPEVFVLASRQPPAEMAVVVKSAGPNALQLVPAIRAEVMRIDRDQPIHDVALMTQVLFDDLAGTYVLTALLSAIGLIALGLSAAGVYGLVSYSVAQRQREIGVRMALGARPGVVVRMLVASAARPVAAGGVAGLMTAIVLAVAIGLSIPGAEAGDPLNYASVALALAIVALLASYLPARRAASIDPVMVLRQ